MNLAFARRRRRSRKRGCSLEGGGNGRLVTGVSDDVVTTTIAGREGPGEGGVGGDACLLLTESCFLEGVPGLKNLWCRCCSRAHRRATRCFELSAIHSYSSRGLMRSSCYCWPSRCPNATKRKPRGTLSNAERSSLLLRGSEHPKGSPEDLEWCDDPAAEQWSGFSCLALAQTVEQCSSEKSCFVLYKLASSRQGRGALRCGCVELLSTTDVDPKMCAPL